MKAYDADLAYIHDVGYAAFARRAALGLLKLLRQHGIRSGLVIDLGCGSGIWAAELLRAGYDVLGIDISPAMIEIARRRAPAARFAVGSFLQVELPPCAAVTSIGECVNYLFDGRNGLPALSRLFRRVHQSLQPGGLLIFDFLQPGAVQGQNPQRSFREGPGWAVLVEKEEDSRRQRLTRRITTFRQTGDTYRRAAEVHKVQLYRSTELARALRAAGFRVSRLKGYGRLRFQGTQAGLLGRHL